MKAASMRCISKPNVDCAAGYLLVDMATFPKSLGVAMPRLERCSPPGLTNVEHLMPCLIYLDELSPEQRAELADLFCDQMEGGSPPSICGHLISALAPQNLARHLSRFLIGAGPEGEQVLWRYFDPRVLSLLPRIYSAEQINALLAPIQSWDFAWCRRWWRLERTADSKDALSLYEQVWPDKTHWQYLKHTRMLTSVLSRMELENLAPDLLGRQGTVLGYLMEGAARLHLSDEDLAEFASWCTRYGRAFRYHYKLDDAWSALERGQISWPALLDQLYARDLERMNAALTGE
ncbi:DUF4123 domain-containing protein [Oxalobacteraceae bacterium A2-2]